jgi:transcriptional regulator with XRE-family HTH domain
MGRSPRPRPARLGEKLLTIRLALGLSQTGMLRRLGLEVDPSAVSGYELGTREPPLPILLTYGEVAGVCVDVLIDDRQVLPAKIPSVPAHKKEARLLATRRKRKR